MNTIDSSAATAVTVAEGTTNESGTDTIDAADVAALKSLVATGTKVQSHSSSSQDADTSSNGEQELDTTSAEEAAAANGGTPILYIMRLKQPDDENGRERTAMTYTFQFPSGGGAATSAAVNAQAAASASAGAAGNNVAAAQDLQSLLKVSDLAYAAANAETEVAAAAADTSSNTLGSSILDSFFAQSSSATQAAVVAEVAPGTMGERVAQIEKMMNTMVDRVLVSDPLVGQNQEVRIKFQDNILPGTEARVWREDGRVMVEFISTRAESTRWLEGSVASLAQRLDERISQTAPSYVSVNSSGDAPADGRSRERHNPWQQAQQEQEDALA